MPTLNDQLSSHELIALEDQYGAHNYKPLDVVLSRGEGVWVWDVEGNRYMDCLSAYSAVNQGHGHPRIRAALIEQAERLPLTSRAFRNDQLGLFYRDLCELTGYEWSSMNTGAEAETALKRRASGAIRSRACRRAGEIISRATCRTHHRSSFSTEAQYREGFGPHAGVQGDPMATRTRSKPPSPNTVAPSWFDQVRAA